MTAPDPAAALADLVELRVNLAGFREALTAQRDTEARTAAKFTAQGKPVPAAHAETARGAYDFALYLLGLYLGDSEAGEAAGPAGA